MLRTWTWKGRRCWPPSPTCRSECPLALRLGPLPGHHSPSAFSHLGPQAAGGGPVPRHQAGGVWGHFLLSLRIRSSCFHVWKTRLIIFHLFSCFESLRRLFFSPLAPSSTPPKTDDFVFAHFPMEPWPKPRGRCRVPPASCRGCPRAPSGGGNG